MDHLDLLESKSVHILREAYAAFENLCMLWSIGKDSTVLLWLARKAFYGHVPFPLVHIDTHYKIPEMIEYRDRLAMEYGLYMVYGENKEALDRKCTFPDGACSRVECCRLLKTEALTHTLNGTWRRYRLNLKTGTYELHTNKEAYTGVIVGARSDEEGSRSKERYFSPRDRNNDWDLDDQPPEFWNQFKTDFAPGTHVRIHPLLDWTELGVHPAGKYPHGLAVLQSRRRHPVPQSRLRALHQTHQVRVPQCGGDHRGAEHRRAVQYRRAQRPRTGRGRWRRTGDPAPQRLYVREETRCVPWMNYSAS